MTTPLLLLLLPLLTLAKGAPETRGVEEELITDNGLDRGDWGAIEFCPARSYAFSFEIKYSGLGFLDDTSINAIRMYCEDETGALTGTTLSSEGRYGQWQGMRTCFGGEYLMGMRANVVPEMGTFGDDLGMDNLQMRCTDNTMLDGLNGGGPQNSTLKGKGIVQGIMDIGGRAVEFIRLKIQGRVDSRDYGEWGIWVQCSAGNRICGHQSRFEREDTLNDDAGITDVNFFCCSDF